MATPPLPGLHHVTAVAGDAGATLAFYPQVLGQRLVKTTVNFDDPGTYHLYFGDEVGTPGTILTFFLWPGGGRGRVGAGETSAFAYIMPAGTTGFWEQRLGAFGWTPRRERRFGETVLHVTDPAGLSVELVETPLVGSTRRWAHGPLDAEHALRAFHSVTLRLAEVEPTGRLLTDLLGFRFVGREGDRYRYAASGTGSYLDLVYAPGPAGRFGVGSIHHIAFRVAGAEAQGTYQTALREAGIGVTEVRDRKYFRSIYFRSPGGVLFEIATDEPGFLFDEPVDRLGQALQLPSWMEVRRAEIEGLLPPLDRDVLRSREGVDG